MIADQILVRLEQLHSNAVIHRDIKPQNFLLGTGTNGNVIYVTDFGLADEYTISCAKAADKIPPRSRLVGTARFASIRGHQGQGQCTCSRSVVQMTDSQQRSLQRTTWNLLVT